MEAIYRLVESCSQGFYNDPDPVQSLPLQGLADHREVVRRQPVDAPHHQHRVVVVLQGATPKITTIKKYN